MSVDGRVASALERIAEFAHCIKLNGDRQGEIGDRQTAILERIATALEARNAASMPVPVLYDVDDPAKVKEMHRLADRLRVDWRDGSTGHPV